MLRSPPDQSMKTRSIKADRLTWSVARELEVRKNWATALLRLCGRTTRQAGATFWQGRALRADKRGQPIRSATLSFRARECQISAAQTCARFS